jgi:hypothetical protein
MPFVALQKTEKTQFARNMSKGRAICVLKIKKAIP